jgi:hypothetical protein
MFFGAMAQPLDERPQLFQTPGWLKQKGHLGGDAVSAAKRAVLDAAVGSRIILSTRSPMPRATGSWRPRSGLDAGVGMGCK